MPLPLRDDFDAATVRLAARARETDHRRGDFFEHRQHKGLNNRAENSHVPVRKRERMMQGFRSWSGLQQFVSTFSAVRNHFVPPRSQRSALPTHLHRLRAMAEWKYLTAVAA